MKLYIYSLLLLQIMCKVLHLINYTLYINLVWTKIINYPKVFNAQKTKGTHTAYSRHILLITLLSNYT